MSLLILSAHARTHSRTHARTRTHKLSLFLSSSPILRSYDTDDRRKPTWFRAQVISSHIRDDRTSEEQKRRQKVIMVILAPGRTDQDSSRCWSGVHSGLGFGLCSSSRLQAGTTSLSIIPGRRRRSVFLYVLHALRRRPSPTISETCEPRRSDGRKKGGG